MLETCPRCGVQYLPKAGEPGCPQCKPAETPAEVDEGWGDLEDVPTPAPPPLQMAPPPPKPTEAAKEEKKETKKEEEKKETKKEEEKAAPPEEPKELPPLPAKAVEATISPGKFEPEITTGQVQRPKKTRARGKKSGRGKAPSQPEQPQAAKPTAVQKRKSPPQAQGSAEKKPAKRKLPAWLLPVAVLLACLAVLALALIASKSKGQ
jgi:hypothetical protein